MQRFPGESRRSLRAMLLFRAIMIISPERRLPTSAVGDHSSPATHGQRRCARFTGDRVRTRERERTDGRTAVCHYGSANSTSLYPVAFRPQKASSHARRFRRCIVIGTLCGQLCRYPEASSGMSKNFQKQKLKFQRFGVSHEKTLPSSFMS